MELDEVRGLRAGESAVIVAGGPSLDVCRQEDFAGHVVIGVNYAYRLWQCDYVLTVKDYIYAEAHAEFDPARMLAPRGAIVHPQTIIWDPTPDIANFKAESGTYLAAGRGGSVCAAMNFACVLGVRSMFVLGVDLAMFGKQYHADGYWDVSGFKPMGWRQSLEDVTRVFEDQKITLRRAARAVRELGKSVYFVNPEPRSRND